MLANINMQNMLSKFSCEKCDYSCSKKSSWNQHLMTMKHKNANFPAFLANNANKKYACDTCDKSFKHKSSYCRHKKTCIPDDKVEEIDSESETNDDPTEKELIMMLIKQNTQLIEQNACLVKNGISNTETHTNSHNNHSNNKTFNLQFFLNETCKDAMNLTDFVNSIQLQLSDLEKMGEIGYTQGLSNIILNNLNELDVSQRPVHCADKKREVLYVKDQDKWEKEQEDKKKLRKAIRRIADKNCFMLNEYKKLHPDCTEYHSKYGDKYNKMMYEAYGGKGDNEVEKENKIISNIAKNVTIDKMN
jgi:Txe/YoeB family toxin of Txe-Axe toxin-antitoxin module